MAIKHYFLWISREDQFSKMQAKASAQVLLNCNYAVELGKKMNFVLVGIDGNDIKSGNKKLILALCKKNVMS